MLFDKIKELQSRWQHIKIQNKSKFSTSKQSSAVSIFDTHLCFGDKNVEKIQSGLIKYAPYNRVGVITAKDVYGHTARGSAALVSPDLVLTTANVIFNRQSHINCLSYLKEQNVSSMGKKYFGMSNKTFYFFAGADGVMKETEGIQVESWRFIDQYADQTSQNFEQLNYALLKLKEKIHRPAYFDLITPCSLCLLDPINENKLQIFGYSFQDCGLPNLNPTLKNGQFEIKQSGNQQLNPIRQVDSQRNLVFYQMTTEKGYSGGPILLNGFMIGIHIAAYVSKKLNYGKILNKKMIEDMKKWQKQMNGIPMKTNRVIHCKHRNIIQLDEQLDQVYIKPETREDKPISRRNMKKQKINRKNQR